MYANKEKNQKCNLCGKKVSISYICSICWNVLCDNCYDPYAGVCRNCVYKILEAVRREEPEELFKTYRCKNCNSIINKADHERYNGLCHGCWMDFKREFRRSGLLGADRASTW